MTVGYLTNKFSISNHKLHYPNKEFNILLRVRVSGSD